MIRSFSRRPRRHLALVPLLLVSGAAPALGQRPTVPSGLPAGPAPAASAGPAVQLGGADSLRPPLSPGRAFLHSFLLPGLGQARLRRQVPGAVYATLEAISFAMLYKTRNELRIAKARARDRVVSTWQVDPVTGAPVLDAGGAFIPVDTVVNHFDAEVVNARRSQYEDWVTLILFNHLFAGADAFVASLLWDLPARVGYRPGPTGPGVGVSIRW